VRRVLVVVPSPLLIGGGTRNSQSRNLADTCMHRLFIKGGQTRESKVLGEFTMNYNQHNHDGAPKPGEQFVPRGGKPHLSFTNC